MGKKWQIQETNKEEVNKISNMYNINKLLATILYNRNIIEDEKIKVFLNPTRNDFYNPYLMPDMQVAVDRIEKAIKSKEKVIIYGDYDVDGITSITVLKKYLLERDLEADEYIPNRLNEGYGLNKQAIKKIASQKYDLMITVDCGISAIEEIEYANSLGLQVIITDHHEPGDVLPNAIAVVDAKRKDNKYPFNQLAGVGVVFKLIQAINERFELEEKDFLKYLYIVAVGTISDIVPLVDENRVITKLGLKLIGVTKNIGLKSLLEIADYKKVDSTAISFGLAPRINACGRLGYAQLALQLFLTENQKEATEISEKLNNYNKKRQEKEKLIYEQAKEKIEKDREEGIEKDVIILGDERWHHGIIGIVASKITDMYFKPSILICFEENEGKGSGRSIPGFDLYQALTKCNTYLDRFGGHSMAVGVSVSKSNFEKFKTEFEEYAQKSNIGDIVPIINIDKEISLKEINISAVSELKLLEPFGEANKMPVFLFRNLKISAIRTLSEGKHIKMYLKEDNFAIDAIGFNLGNLAEEYLIGDKIDVVGSLEINQFNGIENLQINIKDIMKSI